MEEPIVNEEQVIEAPAPAEEVIEAGSKTESTLLLKSLQEERDKRREAEQIAREREEEIERLKASSGTDVFSEEGRVLLAEISGLKREIESSKQKSELEQLQTKYPALKDKSAEFEDYLESNKGMRLDTAAKSFLVENELLVPAQTRKGLEKDSGGGRAAPKVGMSPDDIEQLRVTNFREYAKRLKAGTLGN